MIPKWLGDNSTVYPSFIGPFVVDAEIVPIKTGGYWHGFTNIDVSQKDIDRFGLEGDDRDILEFIVAFTLSRG
jgi:hypothetical protein